MVWKCPSAQYFKKYRMFYFDRSLGDVPFWEKFKDVEAQLAR